MVRMLSRTNFYRVFMNFFALFRFYSQAGRSGTAVPGRGEGRGWAEPGAVLMAAI